MLSLLSLKHFILRSSGWWVSSLKWFISRVTISCIIQTGTISKLEGGTINNYSRTVAVPRASWKELSLPSIRPCCLFCLVSGAGSSAWNTSSGLRHLFSSNRGMGWCHWIVWVEDGVLMVVIAPHIWAVVYNLQSTFIYMLVVEWIVWTINWLWAMY